MRHNRADEFSSEFKCVLLKDMNSALTARQLVAEADSENDGTDSINKVIGGAGFLCFADLSLFPPCGPLLSICHILQKA